MGENLVIVESPAKAKTIEKFLGKGFTVASSFGHIRDLSKKNLGIDIDNGFEPCYEVSADKKKVVADLKKLASKAKTVWLASDEDREGEAIAWHLQQTLNLDDAKTNRIVFHEITKPAILEAIENPRGVDLNLVMAQQARRVLDRLVGFELSPILWKKVAPKLSAGRVQSVAVRLIVEREREISSFVATPYYKISGLFHPQSNGKKLKIKALCNEKMESRERALDLLERCKGADFRIETIQKHTISRTPAPPFTTSALQQEAARKLGFSVSQTMRVAQTLYEKGLITYMRTDSTNLSKLALASIKETIIQNYGKEYSKTRQYKTKSKGAQEAHEAIRPTYAANRTIEGTAQEKRLYNLIWTRAVASQMADASIEKTEIVIGAAGLAEKFVSQGENVLFDGFLKVYMESRDDDQEEADIQLLPQLAEGEGMDALEIAATQHFAQRPPRYSEASLVKKLEELGIGRPSTYAPTITTIMQRGYVVKEDRPGTERKYERFTLAGGNITSQVLAENSGAEKSKLFPTNIGMLVNDYLEDHFQSIMDYGFTAKVEEGFDKIASGKLLWNSLISNFYSSFHKTVEETLKEQSRNNSERVLGTDPATGKVVIARMGRFGALVQKGANDDPQKQFAGMMKGQLIDSITLEEALELFKLPRRVGLIEEKEVTASIGKYGPYLRYDGKFFSLGKELSPYSVTIEEAAAVIEKAKEKVAAAPLKEYQASDIKVLEGKYGPYIKHGGNNYKIPKGTDLEQLDEKACLEIIQNSNPTKSRTKRGLKKQ